MYLIGLMGANGRGTVRGREKARQGHILKLEVSGCKLVAVG
jgi:hypothetical protein